MLAALLLFSALQVAVIVTYYKKITASKDRAASESVAAGTGISASTDSTAGAPRNLRSVHGAAETGGVGVQRGLVAPGTEAELRVKFSQRLASRKERARVLLTSSNYDEQRVQRLRAEQEAAEARLAGGATPPVVGTHIFPPGSEDGPCVGMGPPAEGALAAVVVVTFDRARYLEQALGSLLEVHGRNPDNRLKFPLFVSQDFNSTGVQDVVAQHLDRLSYLQHREVQAPVLDNAKEKVVYYRIANHYRFIMKTMFECFGFERVIILEDDMEISPDFFSFFEATGPLLDTDPSLYCVSSWNDHGQDRFVRNATQLYRSDFFPGLGWMTNRRVWESMRDIWPRAYWDDFMRLNTTRQGRQCIRPEVCRTYNFGDLGSSSGQYFRLFLKPILLNNVSVDWQSMDLGFLQADRYKIMFEAEVAAAQEISTIEEVVDALPGGDYVLSYHSQQHYEALTGRLRMLREWRDGVPRGAYRGIVPVRNLKGARILLVPTSDVNFTAPASAPPGVILRTDSTGALIRSRPRGKGGLPAADWLKQRQEQVAAWKTKRQQMQAGLWDAARQGAVQEKQQQQQQHTPDFIQASGAQQVAEQRQTAGEALQRVAVAGTVLTEPG